MDDPCIEAQGPANPKGYIFWGKQNGQRLAHRVTWVHYYGSISDEIMVLHKCDNPPCVNINHLYLGTNQDNMDDMKIRQRYGERAKLTDDDVRRIRRLYTKGVSQDDLADAFNVTQGAISMIINRKRWLHIA